MAAWDVILLIRPSKLRYANVAAAAALYSLVIGCDVKAVLVDMPKGFEVLLHHFERADDALREALKLGLLPYSQSMVRAYEPLVLQLMKLMRDGVKVSCYLDPNITRKDFELAMRASRLVLRAAIKRLTDRDLEDWLQLLREYSIQDKGVFKDVLSCLASIDELKAIILTGLEGFKLARMLRSEGFKVDVRTSGLPYLRTPLEVMYKRYMQGKLTLDELKCLIKEHVDYVKNYVLRYDSLDEAHKVWSERKAPWLKSLSPKVELEHIFS